MRQGSVGLETQASGSLASSLLSHVHRVPLVSCAVNLSVLIQCVSSASIISIISVHTVALHDYCCGIMSDCMLIQLHAKQAREECLQCNSQHAGQNVLNLIAICRVG